jgi:hypothetical protein
VSERVLLDRLAAAGFCGVSPDSFDRHIRPVLPIVRVGALVRWHRRDLEAWADKTLQLGALLRKSGAKVTLDIGRNITHPCTFCGKLPDTSHELVTIGTYPNGDDLTRPVCANCMALAKAMGGVR